MSTTYTANAKLSKPALGDTGWSTPINGNADALDALTPIGALCVTMKEIPSTTLNVKVAAGKIIAQDGSIVTYAGTASQAITTATTKVLYLDGAAAWALTVGAAYPTTPHVRLATVVAGATTITSVTDDRIAYNVAGTFADAVNLSFGTATGSKIGTATAQKLAFWNATPIIQPAGATQAAPAAYVTGAFGLNSNANMQALYDLVVAMRTALVNAGVMKGSA